jgi:hypothetical protein
MWLANANAARSVPLHGLDGLLTAPAPRTHEELMGFTGMSYLQSLMIQYIEYKSIGTANNCITAAMFLGLPALSNPNPTVMMRRAQIATYLGVFME